MTATGISQKEYLKKYLSSGGDDKKKKKKKFNTKPVVNRLRIVDDDVDIHNMRPLDDDELELYELQEDAPQIAGIIDERPEEVKIKEKYGSKKWKVVADENDMGVKIIDKLSSKDVAELEKSSASHVHGESDIGDLSPTRKSRSDKIRDSEESPLQKNRREFLDNSPVNKKGQKSDSDESPPRKSRKSDAENVQLRKAHQNQGSDESPPRRNHKVGSEVAVHHRKGQNDIADESPPSKSRKNDLDKNRKRQNYDSDESPPRKSKASAERSPPPRRRQNYNSYESPPRQKKRSNSKDSSPYAKGLKYDSDVSPPRRNRKNSSENTQLHKKLQKYDSDESPPRKAKQKTSESPSRRGIHSKLKATHRREISPSNRGRKDFPSSSRLKETNDHMGRKTRKSDSDESPPRRRRARESLSPPNRGKRRNSVSPNRERKRSSRSPPMRNRKGRDTEVSRKSRWGEANDVSWNAQRDSLKHKLSPPLHRDHSSGNSSHKDFHRYDHKKDGRYFSSQRRSDSDISPDRRSKQSDRVDSKKQMLDGRKAGLVGAGELKAEIADLRNREKEMFEKMDVSVSGRGAAPVMRDRKTGKKRNLEEEAKEKQEKDEKQAERDAKYKQWGKGMKQVSDKAQKMEDDLYEMSKPLARYADDADLDKYLRDQEREGDPMLRYIRSKTKSQGESSKPRYEGSFMPNRFGIRPGYRWDGVDRSNGYEKQWFETQNAKKALEDEAYKWSTADM